MIKPSPKLSAHKQRPPFGAKYAWIFVRGYYLFHRETVFRERVRGSRKTESFEEQTITKDKYQSIFSRLMEAILFVIFRDTRRFENWGIRNTAIYKQ